MDVELAGIDLYACFEEGVNEYNAQINQFTARENILGMMGSGMGKMDPQKMSDRMTEKLTKELNLNDAQKAKVHELFATMREFELTQARMLSHYEACTGLDADSIRAKLLPPQDVWLSAEEAQALGICDHVAHMNA